MCGLVGVAGDIMKPDRDMFNQMLQVDVIRGPHSTGVASVTSTKQIDMLKQAVLPQDLMMHKRYDQVVAYDSQVLMGHNRWATVGRINNITAHPFHFEGVVGAHNGTLLNWRNTLEDSALFDVDSECLIWNLQTKGWDHTIERMEGAAALTVYHADTHSLVMYRNAQRPLFFTYNEAGTCLYWASEAWMIRATAQRCGVKLSKDMASLKEETLVSWKLPGLKVGKLETPHARRLRVPEEKKHLPQPFTPIPYNRKAIAEAASNTKDTSTGSGFFTDLRTDSDWKALKPGDKVDFVPCCVSTSETTGQKYLEAVMSEEPWCEVRLYLDAVVIEGMLDSRCEYTGVIATKIEKQGEGDDYLILKGRGLVKGVSYRTEIDDDEDKPELVVTFVTGPGGRMINESEFDKLTHFGCGQCGCLVAFEDDIQWYADSPICEECVDEYKKRN
jgi:glucosamine 6-phosphate synthetase-like amidotransferase/phosphosugar isomerase protein